MWHRRLARKQASPSSDPSDRASPRDNERLEGTPRSVENFARKKNGLKPLASAGYQAFFQSVDHPRHPLALGNEPFRISALRCRGPTDWVRTRPRRLQAPSVARLHRVFAPRHYPEFVRPARPPFPPSSSRFRRQLEVCNTPLRSPSLSAGFAAAAADTTDTTRPPSIHVCPSERPARANLMVRVRFWSRFHLECI